MLTINGPFDSLNNFSIHNEPRVVSTVATPSGNVTEGQYVTVTVTLSSVTTRPTDYEYKIYGNVLIDDYSPISYSTAVTNAVGGTITVAAGYSVFYMFVPLVWDDIIEANEQLSLMFVGGPAPISITIVDVPKLDTYHGRVLASLPYQWLKMTELSGTVAHDFSGNLRDGTYLSASHISATPPSGTPEITVAQSNNVQGNLPSTLWDNNATIEFFVQQDKTGTSASQGTIFAIGDVADPLKVKIGLEFYGNGQPSPYIRMYNNQYVGGNVVSQINGLTILPLNGSTVSEWYRVRVIHRRITPTISRTILKIATSNNWDAWTEVLSLPTGNLEIGGDNLTISPKFGLTSNSALTNIIVWDREVNDNEATIASLLSFPQITSLVVNDLDGNIIEGDTVTFTATMSSTYPGVSTFAYDTGTATPYTDGVTMGLITWKQHAGFTNPTFSDGVYVRGDIIFVPPSVSTFTISFTSIQDNTPKRKTQLNLKVGTFTASVFVNDDDVASDFFGRIYLSTPYQWINFTSSGNYQLDSSGFNRTALYNTPNTPNLTEKPPLVTNITSSTNCGPYLAVATSLWQFTSTTDFFVKLDENGPSSIFRVSQGNDAAIANIEISQDTNHRVMLMYKTPNHVNNYVYSANNIWSPAKPWIRFRMLTTTTTLKLMYSTQDNWDAWNVIANVTHGGLLALGNTLSTGVFNNIGSNRYVANCVTWERVLADNEATVN